MRKLITATFFLVAAYLAVYMGDYSYGYITNDVNGWGVVDGNKLSAGPGWLGAMLVVLGIIGTVACGVLIARIADERDNISELDLVGHGFGLLMAAWAFGALTGPFTAWGMAPQLWLQSHMAMFGVICVWPFVYEGLLGVINSLEQVAKSIQAAQAAQPANNVTSIKSGTKSA